MAISIQEPQIFFETLILSYNRMQQSDWWSYWMPILSDIFVFIYPIFLVVLYLGSTISKKVWNKNIADTTILQDKYNALHIFFSVCVAVCIGMITQLFFDRQRPYIAFGRNDWWAETILHQYLPSSSFPSDHAIVSFAFATAVLCIGLQQKNTIIKIFAGIFFICATFMWLARIITAVHWITDILAWATIWILIWYAMSHRHIRSICKNKIYETLIHIEKKVFFFLYK